MTLVRSRVRASEIAFASFTFPFAAPEEAKHLLNRKTTGQTVQRPPPPVFTTCVPPPPFHPAEFLGIGPHGIDEGEVHRRGTHGCRGNLKNGGNGQEEGVKWEVEDGNEIVGRSTDFNW